MKITFEGQSHQIDANTLINVLLHYQNIVNEASKELSGGSKNIELKINALEKGSFVIDVSLIESAIKHLFSSESVAYIASLYAIVDGTHRLYKHFKGRPVRTEEDKETAKTIIGNTEFNITIRVYNQPPVREAVSKSIETANADVNVEGFSVDCGTNEPTEFKRESFKEYIYDDFDTEKAILNETDEVVDAVLTIIALNFEPGSRWQFMYNGFKIQMTVKDDALMRKIDEGERFGKGDAIHVKMKIMKRYNPTYKAYENKSYKIVEFLEHIEVPRQKELF
ncbi:hypothetical protein [uncultured Bacteroides sp.]|uniref:hypothetical protein n=1 Tax=uncultured Bacteroides sp. TaxID=162156 RepID=UPI0025936EAC|nr:hypothetical protein [uncultured Bacteroides sp.]